MTKDETRAARTDEDEPATDKNAHDEHTTEQHPRQQHETKHVEQRVELGEDPQGNADGAS